MDYNCQMGPVVYYSCLLTKIFQQGYCCMSAEMNPHFLFDNLNRQKNTYEFWPPLSYSA